jgi:hypothetical protein
MVNHYDVLGVSRDSGLEEIKQAYHRLAMEYHPDKNPSPWAAEKMRQLNEAYRILGDPALRTDYDRRTFPRTGDNIYARWYGMSADGFGKSPEWTDPGAGHATAGYEAPRRTVVHESVTFFSFEHLLAGAIVGLAFGIAITAAFVFFGLNSGEQQYGLAIRVLFAAFSAFLPSFVAVFLLRNELNARSEASVCGSITLTFALPVAVIAGSFVTASGDALLTCCLLPVACIVAGWLIGGFVGRAAWDIFRG